VKRQAFPLAIAAVVVAIPSLALARQGAAPSARAGERVFKTASCTACHTLRAAGSTGTMGPNLDRLKPTAAQVAAQVRTGGGRMPPFRGQLSAQQISDVAAYVSTASRGGKLAGPKRPAPPPLTGKALFRVTCGACHTLADARTTGRVGPNLDDESPSYDKVIEQMLEGDEGMPSFRKSLTAAQRAGIAAYVSRVARDRDD
jgi:mono/diheme cytochrome c family protein